MAYVISVTKDNVNYCVRAEESIGQFVLIPVESDSDLTKIFCHPHRIGAVQILNWINDNQPSLACEELKVRDEAAFRK